MKRPHIVFIHADQLHHKALSAYGCPYAHTPGLDHIAREGTSFMESYCAMPQCCPSRASWFTGRMSKEHGVVVNGYPIAPKIPDRLPPLPANFDPAYAERGMPQIRRWSRRDWRYYIYGYYRMVEMVDREIERVYDAVRTSPYAEDTLFIFTSDHGDGLGFHARVSKGFLEEEASRVPAIVAWPGRVREGVRDARHLVSGVDIAATICDYAGAPPLPKMTVARSWRPLLEGRDGPWRDHVIVQSSIGPLSVAVRDARYKSIIDEHRTRLYDIAEDPLEMRDLAGDPRHAAVKARHRALFRAYIGRIEIYPGPPGLAEALARDRRRAAAERTRRRFPRGNLYRTYVAWYGKVRAEG